MANNRLYIRCKACGEELCIGKHFGYHYFTPSDDTDKRLNDFYKKHAFCQKDQDGFADRGDFEITYEIEPNGHMTDYISRAVAIERIANDNVVGGMDRINEYRNSNEHNDYLDGISTAIATIDDLPSANYITEKTNDAIKTSNDVINRADAIDAVMKYKMPFSIQQEVAREIDALPSADAEPTVIRSRTLMATKDFKEWAKRIREENPNVIVIPCDAEVVSADADWIPCSERLPSDDEIVNITWVNHNPPSYYADIAEKPFVASGLRYRDKWYWYSSVCQDLHQDFDLIDKDIEVIAWQPLPKPYKGGDTE